MLINFKTLNILKSRQSDCKFMYMLKEHSSFYYDLCIALWCDTPFKLYAKYIYLNSLN